MIKYQQIYKYGIQYKNDLIIIIDGAVDVSSSRKIFI